MSFRDRNSSVLLYPTCKGWGHTWALHPWGTLSLASIPFKCHHFFPVTTYLPVVITHMKVSPAHKPVSPDLYAPYQQGSV